MVVHEPKAIVDHEAEEILLWIRHTSTGGRGKLAGLALTEAPNSHPASTVRRDAAALLSVPPLLSKYFAMMLSSVCTRLRPGDCRA